MAATTEKWERDAGGCVLRQAGADPAAESGTKAAGTWSNDFSTMSARKQNRATAKLEGQNHGFSHGLCLLSSI